MRVIKAEFPNLGLTLEQGEGPQKDQLTLYPTTNLRKWPHFEDALRELRYMIDLIDDMEEPDA